MIELTGQLLHAYTQYTLPLYTLYTTYYTLQTCDPVVNYQAFKLVSAAGETCKSLCECVIIGIVSYSSSVKQAAVARAMLAQCYPHKQLLQAQCNCVLAVCIASSLAG
jgi:hypothetical protein